MPRRLRPGRGGNNLRIYLQLPDPPGDEVRVLRPEVNDDNGVRAGISAGGGVNGGGSDHKA